MRRNPDYSCDDEPFRTKLFPLGHHFLWRNERRPAFNRGHVRQIAEHVFVFLLPQSFRESEFILDHLLKIEACDR